MPTLVAGIPTVDKMMRMVTTLADGTLGIAREDMMDRSLKIKRTGMY